MSLNRAALRIATVLALKGRTQAGDGVLDSRNAAIDEIAKDAVTPVVSIYTDEDIPGESRSQLLIIEMAATAVQKFPDSEQPIVLPILSDGMLELDIDFLEAEIVDALADPDNEAADVWRTLVLDQVKISSQRGYFGLDADDRIAARQRLITARLLKDSEGEMIPAIEKLVDLMRRDDFYAGAADKFEAFASRHGGRSRDDRHAAELMLPVSSFRALHSFRLLSDEVAE